MANRKGNGGAKARREVPPNTARFVVFQSPIDQKWYWKLTAGNGWTVAIGGEGFPTSGGAQGSIKRATSCMTEAEAHPVVVNPAVAGVKVKVPDESRT